MVEYDPYLTDAERCEYSGIWYRGECSCDGHRRDRQYYSNNMNNDIREVFHYFIRSESYDILQIEPPITPEDLKRAYRKMSLKTHPDKGGSNEAFIKVKNAYDHLVMVL